MVYYANHRDCLARIYLGRRRNLSAPLLPNFALYSYNICLDQVLHRGLPVNGYTTVMAEALAIAHLVGHSDAFDLEFLLAGEVKR